MWFCFKLRVAYVHEFLVGWVPSPIYDFLQELRYLVKIAISVGSSLFKILLSYATGCVTQTHFNDESS